MVHYAGAMSAQSVEPTTHPPTHRDRVKRTYNVHEAKTNLSKLLERVEAGEEITIARNGKVVAVLKAPPAQGVTFGVLSDWDWQVDWDTFDDPDPDLIAAMEDGDL